MSCCTFSTGYSIYHPFPLKSTDELTEGAVLFNENEQINALDAIINYCEMINCTPKYNSFKTKLDTDDADMVDQEEDEEISDQNAAKILEIFEKQDESNADLESKIVAMPLFGSLLYSLLRAKSSSESVVTNKKIFIIPKFSGVFETLDATESIIETDSINSSQLQSSHSNKWRPYEPEITFEIKKRPIDAYLSQKGLCAGCGVYMDKRVFKKQARFCEFSGLFFCRECHSNMIEVIPARVLFYWDFRLYKVSNIAKNYLSAIENEPLYRLTEFDVNNARMARALCHVKVMRIQLCYVKDYLKTCRFSDNTWGNSLLGGRTYLAEPSDMYSMRDLLELENNQLVPQLRKATQKLIVHVLKCPVCRDKGFICEFCKDTRVIYPFQLRVVLQCDGCKSFFHRTCYQAQHCPRCIRIRLRMIDVAT